MTWGEYIESNEYINRVYDVYVIDENGNEYNENEDDYLTDDSVIVNITSYMGITEVTVRR